MTALLIFLIPFAILAGFLFGQRGSNAAIRRERDRAASLEIQVYKLQTRLLSAADRESKRIPDPKATKEEAPSASR